MALKAAKETMVTMAFVEFDDVRLKIYPKINDLQIMNSKTKTIVDLCCVFGNNLLYLQSASVNGIYDIYVANHAQAIKDLRSWKYGTRYLEEDTSDVFDTYGNILGENNTPIADVVELDGIDDELYCALEDGREFSSKFTVAFMKNAKEFRDMGTIGYVQLYHMVFASDAEFVSFIHNMDDRFKFDVNTGEVSVVLQNGTHYTNLIIAILTWTIE